MAKLTCLLEELNTHIARAWCAVRPDGQVVGLADLLKDIHGAIVDQGPNTGTGSGDGSGGDGGTGGTGGDGGGGGTGGGDGGTGGGNVTILSTLTDIKQQNVALVQQLNAQTEANVAMMEAVMMMAYGQCEPCTDAEDRALERVAAIKATTVNIGDVQQGATAKADAIRKEALDVKIAAAKEKVATAKTIKAVAEPNVNVGEVTPRPATGTSTPRTTGRLDRS